MRQAIIVDIDGTLANCDARRKAAMKKNGKLDWSIFPVGMENDPVNEWCRDIIEKYKMDTSIILVSGRSDNYREVTVDWLEDFSYYDYLYMRKTGDYRQDTIVKQEIYDEYIKGKYDILFCIDDRKSVVDMWRANGLVCLQCADGNF